MIGRLIGATTFLVVALLGLDARSQEADAEARRMFALNLYHEARSQGREGMVAVGWIVLNRVADEKYPDSILAVITDGRGRRCEFGWWCDGRSDKPTEDDMWARALAVTEQMLGDSPPADPTLGALWFHESYRDRPRWMGDDVRRTATIGDHHFYGRN